MSSLQHPLHVACSCELEALVQAAYTAWQEDATSFIQMHRRLGTLSTQETLIRTPDGLVSALLGAGESEAATAGAVAVLTRPRAAKACSSSSQKALLSLLLEICR